MCAACMRLLIILDGLQNGPEEVQDEAWLCVTMGKGGDFNLPGRVNS